MAYGLAPNSLRRMIDIADRHLAGVVRVSAPGEGGPAVLLWRTAALARAEWVRADGESLLDAVTEVHGRRDVLADDVGVVAATRAEAGGRPGQARRSGSLVPSMVEVEGVRSLARATVVVAWLAGRRLRASVRRVVRR